MLCITTYAAVHRCEFETELMEIHTIGKKRFFEVQVDLKEK